MNAATASSAPSSAAGSEHCPRCGSALQPGQSWCLSCGLAARTIVAPTPRWRYPLAVAAGAVLVALAAIVLSFVVITGNDPPVPPQTPPGAARPAEIRAAGRQLLAIKVCLGPGAAEVPLFAPTVQLAEAQGGGVSATRFGHSKLEFIVFPTTSQARRGLQDAQLRLLALANQRPDSATRLRPNVSLVSGNVVQIIVRGPLEPVAAAKTARCAAAGT